jgi:hypothetical protein
MQSNVITLEEIAAELHVQPAHAARKCRQLANDAGFPRSLPGLPNRWSRAQVEAWFAAGGAPAPVAKIEPAPDQVAAARQILEARYVGH